MAKALLDDTAVSTSAVHQPQSAKQDHIRRSCISPARYSCMSTAIKIKAKSFLDDTVVSTRAVYQPRELYINSNHERKRTHFWTTHPCRPGRCLNREQQRKSISGAAVYHRRGIAVYQQQSKPQTNALKDDIAVSTGLVYQPLSTAI